MFELLILYLVNVAEAYSFNGIQCDSFYHSLYFVYNRLCRQDIRKCLNLDVMWAMHAKKWLLPNNSAKNQQRPLVFLKK